MGSAFTFIYGKQQVSPNFAKLTYNLGVTFEQRIKSNLSIKTGLGLTNKGFKSKMFYTDDNALLIGESNITINHIIITLPILLKYSNKKNLFFNAGPFIGYLMKSTFKLNDVNDNPIAIDNSAFYKKMEAGLVFGIGKNFQLFKKLNLDVELQNSLGITNIQIHNANKTNLTSLLFGLSL